MELIILIALGIALGYVIIKAAPYIFMFGILVIARITGQWGE